MLKAIDLCCGAGGWSCAARGLPIKFVLAVDLWDRAIRTYALNNPGVDTIVGDLRNKDVQAEILRGAPSVDLVVGGIPCEWLSPLRTVQKVKKAEIEKERATLDSVLSLVEKCNPIYWCLEDVERLARELPPFTPYQIINAKHYSAQRRKRIYVGAFPRPEMGANQEVMGSRTRPGPYRIGPRSADREIGYRNTFTGKMIMGARLDRKSPTVCGWHSRRDADICIVDEDLPGGRRQIEWQEAAVLQGFPEDFVFYGSPGDVSKMVGQAVQIDTCKKILEGIVKGAGEDRLF